LPTESHLINFIFFVTHECSQKARLLHFSALESLAEGKHFSLFCPFSNYKENELL